MVTIVNPGSDDDGGSSGVLIGVIAIILVVVILLFYGLPMMRGRGTPAPQGPSSESGVNVDVPEKVDVNVDTNSGDGY